MGIFLTNKKEKESRKFYQMGGVDIKVGVNLRNLKRGGWAKRRDYNYEGGTCDPLRNHEIMVSKLKEIFFRVSHVKKNGCGR